jgi:hypothetical protein
MRRYVGIAAGLGLLLAAIWTITGAPALAQTFKPLFAFIMNDDANPVPVKVIASPATTAV